MEVVEQQFNFTLSPYAQAVGRRGRFVPRHLHVFLERHCDGTPLIRLQVYSRRRGEGEAAPIELVMALRTWWQMSLNVAQAGIMMMNSPSAADQLEEGFGA
jgi:hypothetical protein